MVVRIIFSFIIVSYLGVASSNSAMPNKDTNSSATVSVKEINDAINRAVSDKVATIYKEIIAGQPKVSLDENDVRDIFNDKFLNIMGSIQSEYKSAILSTNTNMTYFGIMVGLVTFAIGFLTLISFQKERKKLSNNAKKDYRKIIENINRIHYHQNILLNYINKRLVTNLSKKEVQEAYADYNALHEKVIDITSLDKETIVKTLPELNTPKFKQLKKSVPMQNYLKQIREYFKDDSGLVSSIDKAIS